MVTLKRRKFFRYSRIIVIERRIFFYGKDTEKIIKLRIWKEIDFILFCSIIKIGKEKREGKDNPSFIFL